MELRTRSQRFARGEMAFEEFRPALGWFTFDDEGRWEPRLAVKDLPDELQVEYLFYVKWLLATNEDLFKSSLWKYGESQEPYGWIDKNKYQRLFADEFHTFKSSEIPMI